MSEKKQQRNDPYPHQGSNESSSQLLTPKQNSTGIPGVSKIQHKFEYPPGITAAWGYWSHGPFSSMIYLLDIFSQKPAPVPSPLVNHVPPILVNNRHTKNFHVPPILVNNRHSKNFHTYFHITPIFMRRSPQSHLAGWWGANTQGSTAQWSPGLHQDPTCWRSWGQHLLRFVARTALV